MEALANGAVTMGGLLINFCLVYALAWLALNEDLFSTVWAVLGGVAASGLQAWVRL